MQYWVFSPRAAVMLLLAMLCPVLAKAAGPWPQGKGNAYIKLSEWWVRFDRHYTDVGRTDPNLTTGIYNTFVYGSYGLTDRLTGIVNANIFGRNVMNKLQSGTTGEELIPGESLNAFGDVDLALKYTLTPREAAWQVAVTGLLGIPSGQDAGGSQGALQTGDGEFNQTLRCDVGRGFALGEQKQTYFSVYAGINNRTQGFSEEFRGGLEAGLNLVHRKLWLIGRLDVVESFKNGEESGMVNSTSIFANNAEFTSAGLELAYYVSRRVGVTAAAAAALRGEIIAAAPSYSVGVFVDLR